MAGLITPMLASAAVAGQTWHGQLLQWTEEFAIIVLVSCVLACVYRLLRGPHLADRALAVDIVAVQLIGLVILLTMWLGSLVLFDGVLVLALLGFTGTVAMAQYIGRPHLRKKLQSREGAGS